MPAKTPLVLVPGLLCDGALWAAQVDGLADSADMTVADVTQHDSVAGMAKAVLGQAPDRFALAGLSMGGYVALEIMRQAPGQVTRLALLDTSARADTADQKKARRELIAMAQTGEFKGVTPRLFPRWVHPSRVNDKALADAVMSMTQRVGREAFLREQTAIMNRPDSRPGLPDIQCPTLVLCGHEDQTTPPALHREMAADIPNARLAVIAECGHLSTMERPEAVNREMRLWLTGD